MTITHSIQPHHPRHHYECMITLLWLKLPQRVVIDMEESRINEHIPQTVANADNTDHNIVISDCATGGH